MKNKRILLTGGGTGGHLYPLLAVAEEIKRMEPQTEICYAGPRKHWTMFQERGIACYTIAGSKIRRYAALGNILDIPKFFWSLLQAWWRLYFLMPDAVFSKGGPGSFPVVLAAKFYFIPVLMHESDSAPSLNSKLAAPLSKRIGISFAGAASYFPKEKTALIGNPVRSELLNNLSLDKSAAKKELGFDPNKFLIVILGGSQGSVRINEFITGFIPKLVEITQVLHQTGETNLRLVSENIKELPIGYKTEGYLDINKMKLALTAADLAVSRAGAGAVYELAAFGVPSILLPLSDAANDHQRKNAYEYGDWGAAEVLEEPNLTENLFLSSIKSLLNNPEKLRQMGERAKSFYKPEAAVNLAKELLNLVS